MMAEWKVVGKVVLAFLSGLLLDHFAGPRWSSWNETMATFTLVMGICFLAALSPSGAIRGRGERPAVIAFALSFLVWPAFNGISLRSVGALGFFGILEVLPAIAGGVAGLALRRSHIRNWWFVAAAILALSLLFVGPGR